MTRCFVVVVLLLGSVTARAEDQPARDSRGTCFPQPECRIPLLRLPPGPAGPAGGPGIFTRSPFDPPTPSVPLSSGRVDISNTRPGQ